MIWLLPISSVLLKAGGPKIAAMEAELRCLLVTVFIVSLNLDIDDNKSLLLFWSKSEVKWLLRQDYIVLVLL